MSPRSPSPSRSVAVVVPTHDRPDRLARCLEALAAQEHRPDQIVVVDDGSSPPAQVPAELGGVPVALIRNDPPLGPAAARNRGWGATRSDYVLFTDDDCRPAPAWVGELAAAARADAIVVGRTLPDPADGPLRSPLDRSMRVESCDGSFPTCNIAYPRAALVELGGFDEEFPTSYGEDTDLGQRAITAGRRGEYAPDALVHHAVHRQSLGAAVAERRRLGELVRLVAIHPQLRDGLWDGYFWNSDHRWLVTGAAGAGLAAGLVRRAKRPRRSALARAAMLVGAGAAVLPGARYAYWCRRRSLALAGDGWVAGAITWFALDAAEVAFLARGSARYRALLL